MSVVAASFTAPTSNLAGEEAYLRGTAGSVSNRASTGKMARGSRLLRHPLPVVLKSVYDVTLSMSRLRLLFET